MCVNLEEGGLWEKSSFEWSENNPAESFLTSKVSIEAMKYFFYMT